MVESLGYDIRKLYDPRDVWTDHDINTYLYKTDIKSFLSVDTTSSKSILEDRFYTEKINDLRNVINDRVKDLQQIDSDKNLSLIEIFYLKKDLPAGDFINNDDIGNPSIPMSLAGFDIADLGLISALSNCGISIKEKEILICEYKLNESLNQFHLIQDIKIAHSLKNKFDELIPEHAPFYIYSIFYLPLNKLKNLGNGMKGN